MLRHLGSSSASQDSRKLRERRKLLPVRGLLQLVSAGVASESLLGPTRLSTQQPLHSKVSSHAPESGSTDGLRFLHPASWNLVPGSSQSASLPPAQFRALVTRSRPAIQGTPSPSNSEPSAPSQTGMDCWRLASVHDESRAA